MASQTPLKVAVVGLDTSHSIEFARLMQSPDIDPSLRVAGLAATRCLRFETPFQDKNGLDKRQEQLEAWGVQVTEDFDTAVGDCDAVLMEINDQAYHLEYFRRCADLGKPIFLDKPLADTVESMEAIFSIAEKKGVRFFCSSSLRYAPSLDAACKAIPHPECCSVFGPLGKAPAGSSLVWYGVHSFEMLVRAMGTGAREVHAQRDGRGVIAVVHYEDGRRGVVELVDSAYVYGGSLRTQSEGRQYLVDSAALYRSLLLKIEEFFRTGSIPVSQAQMREVMALMDASERSLASGSAEKLHGVK